MTEEISYLDHNILTENINSLNNIPYNSDRITYIEKNLSDSDTENEIRLTKFKSKSKRVSGSDIDTDNEINHEKVSHVSSTPKSDSDDSKNEEEFFCKKKSRIRKISDSESDSESISPNYKMEITSKYSLTRTKIKNQARHDMFKKLKQPKSKSKEHTDQPKVKVSDDEESDKSPDGALPCLKIKKKLKKESMNSLKTICDPDTTDEETNVIVTKSKPLSTQLISPKTVRISAKQAMENMQKIKSESNRMLREKNVSLPYHRPKALTLKDIMNRRKPAVTSDGKSLPIKMNNEQLKEYAFLLEQRQKEMMELCKSDTDDEEQNFSGEQVSVTNLNKSEEDKDICDGEKILDHTNDCPSGPNDKIYDNINMEQKIKDNNDHNLENQNIEEATVVRGKINESCEELTNNTTENVARNLMEKQKTVEASCVDEKHTLPVNIEDKEIYDVTTASENNGVLSNAVNKHIDQESQIISLHYDSEKTQIENIQNVTELTINDKKVDDIVDISMVTKGEDKKNFNDEFSDSDFAIEDLEDIIENVEDNKDTLYKSLPKIGACLEVKPMLIGTPGMVIDLEQDSGNTQKKLTGVELLKERFTYFARLKSLEDMEKDREKKFKPGVQHLKLKQELEDQIAEQRSLEWEKRLQVENQLKSKITADEAEGFDGEDIEKIEAKLEENVLLDDAEESSSEEEEEEEEYTDVFNSKDPPRIRNPLIDDEAEISDDEGVDKGDDVECNEEDENNDDDDNENEDDVDDNDSECDDDEESSESEDEPNTTCRKGRILKAFEDSDDDGLETLHDEIVQSKSHDISESQDDEIQLAQPQKTYSDDLFTSQESTHKISNTTDKCKDGNTSLEELGSQTFSILKSGSEIIKDKLAISSEKLDVICETQPCSDENFDAIVGMCTGGFSQNLVTPQSEPSQLSQSQEIGEDIADLCTGKFYDNPFVPQAGDEVENEVNDESINESEPDKPINEINVPVGPDTSIPTEVQEGENILLKSILEELNDPEFDSPKPNKYFFNGVSGQNKKSNPENERNTTLKKKFVIESDDEITEKSEAANKKKKRKKRKLENRALQISDDEEYSEPDLELEESDIEEDNDRLIEYDSEENEVVVKSKVQKKKRLGNDFFEKEAELTSEDEWIGSGDEDEAGLDRMEREEGDDDTFHQGKLQRELGEIHMREVLDQDKREVRLLQELFFEDGDLGDGHRQRKFRWRNADGEEELGTNADEYADTQEDEFESEEQWRKQRHEREMFLRKLQQEDNEEKNVSMNRSAFIKAKLASKAAAGTIIERNSNVENNSSTEIKSGELTERKTNNNVPSPKKPFIMLQQSYHNSLLTRGRGALARLAALATPLAGDGDDTPKVTTSSSRGNFVFAAITPTETESKVTKRKANTALDTPRLLKKMKQESNKKSSLFDHISIL